MILLLFSQKGTRLEKIESNLHLQVRPGLSSTCLGCIYIFFSNFYISQLQCFSYQLGACKYVCYRRCKMIQVNVNVKRCIDQKKKETRNVSTLGMAHEEFRDNNAKCIERNRQRVTHEILSKTYLRQSYHSKSLLPFYFQLDPASTCC